MQKTIDLLARKKILAFIWDIPNVVQFLHEKFQENEYLQSVMKCLELWKDISQFIHMTTVIDRGQSQILEQERREWYELKIQKFERNVKCFYLHGAKSLLTKSIIGDQENFYMHVLRYYIPTIVHDTWGKYELGVGIFSMQGFERRNKESKNTLKRFTKNKGNILKKNMARLWDKFYFRNPEHDI